MPYYAVPPPHPEHEPLPSYEVAIRRDPLSLVAPYLRPADLFPCLLVSRVWHDALLPYVWKDPARFWGMGEKSELCTPPPPAAPAPTSPGIFLVLTEKNQFR